MFKAVYQLFMITSNFSSQSQLPKPHTWKHLLDLITEKPERGKYGEYSCTCYQVSKQVLFLFLSAVP